MSLSYKNNDPVIALYFKNWRKYKFIMDDALALDCHSVLLSALFSEWIRTQITLMAIYPSRELSDVLKSHVFSDTAS